MKYKKVNIDQEIRHERNIAKLNIKNEKLSRENKKKIFKKYVSFYWQRKSIETELKNKRKEIVNKLNEKSEKLIMLEKLNEKKRDNIIKKLKSWDKRKKEKQRNIRIKILDNKKLREKRSSFCAQKRKEFLKEETVRRNDILFNQNQRLLRSLSRDRSIKLKRRNVFKKTSQEQIILERNLMTFNREMNRLKSQSIYKKPIQERIKIYKEIKRKEAERKKEMEEMLKKY
jgi:hypothetical protein